MEPYDTKRDGISLMIKETGEVFNSLQACADYLGVNVSWLSRATRGDRGLCTVHGYHIVRLDDSIDISRRDRRGRPGTKIRIVETGDEYSSISECARALNGSVGTIHDVLHSNRNKNTYKGLHFEKI